MFTEIYNNFVEVLGNFTLVFYVVGLPAQMIFMSRFVVQWHASEKAKKSVIPLAFWYLSLGGSIGLAIYGLLINDPIHFFGQIFNTAIYIRNLMLIHREKKEAIAAGEEYEVPEIIHEKEKICLN